LTCSSCFIASLLIVSYCYIKCVTRSRLAWTCVPSSLLMEAPANMCTAPRALDISWPAPSYSISTSGEPNDVQPPSYRASIRNNTSLDITQRLERRLAHYNASQNVVKRWLFEIVSVTTSAICMGKARHICFCSCRKLTIPRCNNCHPCASQQQTSSNMASRPNYHHCPHQDCVCCSNTTNIRGHWAT
jgi:hypothetical protein